MPRKRRKRMKLPNGFGSIKYLGDNRRKPYAAFPPVAEYTAKGPVSPKALGYTETWEEAYELLSTYKLKNEGKIKTCAGVFIDRTPLFKELFEDFYKEKYRKQLADGIKNSSMYSTNAAFKNCSALHDIPFGTIRYKDLQDVLNNCTLKHASRELIVSLMHQMYAYAIKYDIVEKDYSASVFMPIDDDDEPGEPFTEQELKILWHSKEDSVVQMLLIMCYSGYRIKAYTKMDTHLKEKYFRGGVKTRTSRDRDVPIHPAVYDFVANRYSGKNLLGCSVDAFRKLMYAKLSALGIDYTKDGKKHTPHDCRHTFSMLCEKYEVPENDRIRMMGHKFKDITNDKYGHRTIEDLRKSIEKIQNPYL